MECLKALRDQVIRPYLAGETDGSSPCVITLNRDHPILELYAPGKPELRLPPHPTDPNRVKLWAELLAETEAMVADPNTGELDLLRGCNDPAFLRSVIPVYLSDEERMSLWKHSIDYLIARGASEMHLSVQPPVPIPIHLIRA